jgi:hypothetical protein
MLDCMDTSASTRRGLQKRRVRLPIVQTAHAAAPGDELTPERVAEILLAQEVEAFFGTLDGRAGNTSS